MWYVYVLENRYTGQVYTGSTNRPKHRLEAHNQQRSGGARSTKRWKPGSARMVLLVGPFVDSERSTSKSAALSFERKMKRTTIPHGGIKGRVQALNRLIASPGGRVTDKVNLKENPVMIRTTLYLGEYRDMCNPKASLNPWDTYPGLFSMGHASLPCYERDR